MEARAAKVVKCSTGFQPVPNCVLGARRHGLKTRATNKMQPNDLRNRLSGVIAFPVTPFRSDLSLDLDGLRRNLRALLKHPICAIVAAAGTGELYSLSRHEHLEVVRVTVEEVSERVPVMAGVGFNPPIAADL